MTLQINTTVVTKWVRLQPRQRVPLDADHGNTGRHAGAGVATVTMRGCGGLFGARPALTATIAAAARPRFTACEATLGFERGQWADLRGAPLAFFERLDSDRPCAHDGQQGQGPPRQREMPIPARPAPHFIVVQAHFPLRLLNAALDGPAAPGHPHDLLQRRSLGSKHHRGGQLGGGAETAPDQQPAAPARLQRCGQGLPSPVRPARPPRCRQAGQARFHRALLGAQPHLFLARHGQDIGLRPALQPPPQAPVLHTRCRQ